MCRSEAYVTFYLHGPKHGQWRLPYVPHPLPECGSAQRPTPLTQLRFFFVRLCEQVRNSIRIGLSFARSMNVAQPKAFCTAFIYCDWIAWRRSMNVAQPEAFCTAFIYLIGLPSAIHECGSAQSLCTALHIFDWIAWRRSMNVLAQRPAPLTRL